MTIPSGESASHTYRADIDGLRAVAVLLVIGFHAFPNWLGAGFIGVDVFFVISGYLITGIIFTDLRSGAFRFSDFYARRIRRIFPSLILVLLGSWVAGVLILQGDEFSRLLKHIASGGSFIINYVLASEGGYFDRVAESKPLLHLWSLAVEEQFYVVWPLLLWSAWQLRGKVWIPIIILGLLSFLLNVVDVQVKPIDTFYLLKTRFWELALGAGLAYVQNYSPHFIPKSQRIKTYMSFGGASLLLAAIVLIGPATRFPGAWALLPTLAALLLIASGKDGFVNKVVLSRPALVWIGLISFPLYLWHWSIFSFARIYLSGAPSPTVMMGLIAFSFLLAALSYWLVERPIRIRYRANGVAVILVIVLTAVVATSYYHFLQPVAVDARTQDAKAKFYAYFADAPPMRWLNFFEKQFRHQCNFYQIDEYYAARPTNKPRVEIAPECYQVDQSKPHTVLIWGDSHAQMLYAGLEKYLPSNWQILQVASSGCAARIDNLQRHESEYCAHSNKFALELISQAKPDVVVVAQSNGHNIESMNRVSVALKKLGIRGVIFVGPSPHWQDDLPKILIRRLWPQMPERTWVGVNREVQELNAKLKNNFIATEGRSYVDTIGLFCNPDGCLTRLGEDKQRDATSWDYGHLTALASEYLASKLLVPEIIKYGGR
jgi:peptidoglycan/LPS O-acetylase OafA/YrhL